MAQAENPQSQTPFPPTGKSFHQAEGAAAGGKDRGKISSLSCRDSGRSAAGTRRTEAGIPWSHGTLTPTREESALNELLNFACVCVCTYIYVDICIKI